MKPNTDPRNQQALPNSPSGLDLDPDPLEVLHDSHKAAPGDFFEQIFSNVVNAVRRAVESVLSVFSSSDPDVDPIIHIHISKPRNLRRNENELPPEWKKDNDFVRAKYYDSLFKPESAKVGTADTHTKQDSQMPEPSTSTPEKVADVEGAKQIEVPIGEKTFQQYVTLFQEKEGNILFSPGYFAFNPECLTYAHDLAKTAIGKTIDKMPNAVEIKAAKALLDGDHANRLAQEQAAAWEARGQEKIKKQELEKTKLPGQLDFEEFFAMYEKNKSHNSRFIIFENSKFLTKACMDYANNISADQPLSRQAMAANYLDMWNRDPAKALENAKASPIFQMPPPPARLAARVQIGTVEVPAPLPARKSVAFDLQLLSNAERDKLVSISKMSLDTLNQAFKGLRAASVASIKKDDTSAKAGPGQRAGFRLGGADGAPTEIDDLQQAQYWLKKISDPNVKIQLEAYPKFKAFLQSSQRISEVIEEQLSLLAPVPKKTPLKPTSKPTSKPTKLESLSAEELMRAEADFDQYVNSFTRAINNRKGYDLGSLSGPKYLTRGNIAIAQKVLDEAKNNDVAQTDDADNEIRVNRQSAAAFLVNQAEKLVNKRKTT